VVYRSDQSPQHIGRRRKKKEERKKERERKKKKKKKRKVLVCWIWNSSSGSVRRDLVMDDHLAGCLWRWLRPDDQTDNNRRTGPRPLNQVRRIRQRLSDRIEGSNKHLFWCVKRKMGISLCRTTFRLPVIRSADIVNYPSARHSYDRTFSGLESGTWG